MGDPLVCLNDFWRFDLLAGKCRNHGKSPLNRWVNQLFQWAMFLMIFSMFTRGYETCSIDFWWFFYVDQVWKQQDWSGIYDRWVWNLLASFHGGKSWPGAPQWQSTYQNQQFFDATSARLLTKVFLPSAESSHCEVCLGLGIVKIIDISCGLDRNWWLMDADGRGHHYQWFSHGEASICREFPIAMWRFP